jgi:hypothetical protein
MKRDTMRRVRAEVEALARDATQWSRLASRVGEVVRALVHFDRACFHPVDPGTHLFTGSLSHNMVCSGAWLAQHEVRDRRRQQVARPRPRERARSVTLHRDER